MIQLIKMETIELFEAEVQKLRLTVQSHKSLADYIKYYLEMKEKWA